MDIEPASQDEPRTCSPSNPTGADRGRGQRRRHGRSPPGGASELIGIAIALLVLILTFGSLVAAGLPIVTAIFGVALGMTA